MWAECNSRECTSVHRANHIENPRTHHGYKRIDVTDIDDYIGRGCTEREEERKRINEDLENILS